jgi:hypothetical protein
MPRDAPSEEEAMSDAPAPAPAPEAPKPPAGPVRLVTAACILALVGVAFSLAHFIWPTPLLFSLFMIVGQGSFGLALLLYAVAIFTDLKRQKVL